MDLLCISDVGKVFTFFRKVGFSLVRVVTGKNSNNLWPINCLMILTCNSFLLFCFILAFLSMSSIWLMYDVGRNFNVCHLNIFIFGILISHPAWFYFWYDFWKSFSLKLQHIFILFFDKAIKSVFLSFWRLLKNELLN